jgi:hypothetical protein
MTRHRITLLYCSRGRRVDGVRDHSKALTAALREAGATADLVDRGERGWVHERADGADAPIDDGSLLPLLAAGDWVILQYSVFAFGRWGFAPWLPRLMQRLSPTTRIAVMVHEPFVAWGTVRQSLMSLGQRVQMRAILKRARVTLTATEAWDQQVRRWSHHPLLHLPVGSNLPDRRNSREETRARLGIGDDEIVLASLSTGHDSGLHGHIASALRDSVRDVGRITYLNLGATAPAAPTISGLNAFRPGWLTADALAEHISSADVFIAPFVDGASTRRTSIMAALQHGVPVVSTDGRHTDRVFRDPDSGVVLAPADNPAAFGRTTASLATSADLRARLAVSARKAYTAEFAWDVLARRVVAALDAS